MNIVISGSRFLDDYQFFKEKMDKLTAKLDKKKLTVLFGDNKGTPTTRGTDAMAKWWAQNQKWIETVEHFADWEKNGKGAGPIRNGEMLRQAGSKAVLIAFHDGRTEGCGTLDCINQAKSMGIKVIVIKVDLDEDEEDES